MVPVETALVFCTSSLLLALAPGPDNLFVLAQAAQYGRRAGLAVTTGLCTGIIGHTTAVALGVAALLQTSQLAFALLKYLGAAYLSYLAVQAFRDSGGAGGQRAVACLSTLALYRRGVLMNLCNPKVSLFFLAFLPQFVDSGHGPVVQQVFFLGFLFGLTGFLVFGGISLLAGSVGQWLMTSPARARLLNRLAGTLFAGLAIKLLLATQT